VGHVSLAFSREVLELVAAELDAANAAVPEGRVGRTA
jgi:hypothetical protein